MTIDANKMAQKSQRAVPKGGKPVVSVATEEQLTALLEEIDELKFRVLTLEVANNEKVKEINHLNAWLNDFRGRHEVLYNLPWYRFYIWLMPHMGLPHFPKRETLKGIRIRDRAPQVRR
jgi:hypothetical protein